MFIMSATHVSLQFGLILPHSGILRVLFVWQTMKVDGLPDGRDQPFYHSLVDTDSQPLGQTTYVAQVRRSTCSSTS